jgi:hypothetical protein
MGEGVPGPGERPGGTSRRRFISYLVAAPVLVMGIRMGLDVGDATPAFAIVPSLPSPPTSRTWAIC